MIKFKRNKWFILSLSVIVIFIIITVFMKNNNIFNLKSNPTDLEIGKNEDIENKIESMTLEEKVGQMIQAERGEITLEEIKKYNIGSILSGGGSTPSSNTVVGWVTMYNEMQEAALSSSSKVPIIYGIDAVHGHSNVLDATIFPHNIGLGAANNSDLMYQIGSAVGEEIASTGLDWNFYPAVSIAQDIRWGRTYESLSENPERVEGLIGNYIEGLQEQNIAATAKHYVGDGQTTFGTGEGDYLIDRGNVQISEEELRSIQLPVYKEAISNGVKTVMVSFSSFNGLKMHENKYLITDVLKDELGFKGVVVSDWDGINEINADTLEEKVILAVNSGIDLLMQPYNWMEVYNTLIDAVNNNKISEERIDDAVYRLLKLKYDLDLFDNPLAEAKENVLGNDEHRELAREAVRESLVLLKNDSNTLPLNTDQKVLLVGPGANNLGLQCGGWTMEWQGIEENDLTSGTTIRQAFKDKLGDNLITSFSKADEVDIVVVVLAEKPYAEGFGDNGELTLDSITGYKSNIDILEKVKELDKPIVTILLAGRPLLIDDYVNDWDSFVMAWLPGTEGNGVSDVIFGDYNFKGTLPMTWPKTIEQADDSVIMDDYNGGNYQYEYDFGLKY
ncbi:glycoside hydrolase family 3 protein [Clostridium sp. DL1XJH146]